MEIEAAQIIAKAITDGFSGLLFCMLGLCLVYIGINLLKKK